MLELLRMADLWLVSISSGLGPVDPESADADTNSWAARAVT